MKSHTSPSVKQAVESASQTSRFSLKNLTTHFQSNPPTQRYHELGQLTEQWQGKRMSHDFQARLIRSVFLIERVNKEITSTKYGARWSSEISIDDPQYASFNTCVEILDTACSLITSAVESDPKLIPLLSFLKDWGLSHEFPLDYHQIAKPLHVPQNIKLTDLDSHLKLLKLRKYLLSPDYNPGHREFQQVFSKIQVKSYLTDRALTGDYKTNREKRWETHPDSPQFALRGECLQIEQKLIVQLVSFANFPAPVIQFLKKDSIMEPPTEIAKCPITLDELDFTLLISAVANPVHGKSPYQVGHLNPLKAGTSQEFRHTASNVAWISEDGNRIQGHLSLADTRALLKRIAANYRKFLQEL